MKAVWQHSDLVWGTEHAIMLRKHSCRRQARSIAKDLFGARAVFDTVLILPYNPQLW